MITRKHEALKLRNLYRYIHPNLSSQCMYLLLAQSRSLSFEISSLSLSISFSLVNYPYTFLSLSLSSPFLSLSTVLSRLFSLSLQPTSVHRSVPRPSLILHSSNVTWCTKTNDLTVFLQSFVALLLFQKSLLKKAL